MLHSTRENSSNSHRNTLNEVSFNPVVPIADPPAEKPNRFSAANGLAEKLTPHPGLFTTLLVLVLIGLRPHRLSTQLRARDERAWEDFRDGLLKRWEMLMITTGLVMGASANALFSDKVEKGSYLMALASLCCSIIAITFGTALTFVFRDAPAEDILKLARRPVRMIFALSMPTVFAIGAVLTLYACITALAFQQLDTEVVDILARMGTTGGAVIMIGIFLYFTWLVQGLDK